MSLTIPDEWLSTTHLTEHELLQEIVVLLYQQERLTLGQASTWLGMDRLTFQQILAERQIPVHYGVDDYKADLDTLRRAAVQALRHSVERGGDTVGRGT